MLSTQLNRERTAHKRDRYRCQDDQALQKIFKKLSCNDPEFHNQQFDTKNNQTFGGDPV